MNEKRQSYMDTVLAVSCTCGKVSFKIRSITNQNVGTEGVFLSKYCRTITYMEKIVGRYVWRALPADSHTTWFSSFHIQIASNRNHSARYFQGWNQQVYQVILVNTSSELLSDQCRTSNTQPSLPSYRCKRTRTKIISLPLHMLPEKVMRPAMDADASSPAAVPLLHWVPSTSIHFGQSVYTDAIHHTSLSCRNAHPAHFDVTEDRV